MKFSRFIEIKRDPRTAGIKQVVSGQNANFEYDPNTNEIVEIIFKPIYTTQQTGAVASLVFEWYTLVGPYKVFHRMYTIGKDNSRFLVTQYSVKKLCSCIGTCECIVFFDNSRPCTKYLTHGTVFEYLLLAEKQKREYENTKIKDIELQKLPGDNIPRKTEFTAIQKMYNIGVQFTK